MRLEEKVPIPVPSVLVLSAVVGDGPVLQHTPREITAAPPSLDIFPPALAEATVIAVTSVVDITGLVGSSFLQEDIERITAIKVQYPNILKEFFMLYIMLIDFLRCSSITNVEIKLISTILHSEIPLTTLSVKQWVGFKPIINGIRLRTQRKTGVLLFKN
jgi:hypothetical protein